MDQNRKVSLGRGVYFVTIATANRFRDLNRNLRARGVEVTVILLQETETGLDLFGFSKD